jgi:glycosyltransferase involved in cell wall biosynthesis
MTGKVILIAVNASWNIVNFRKELIAALRANGHQVIVVAPEDEYSPRLRALGVRYIPLKMNSQGLSPAEDLLLLGRYFAILREVKPDLFLGYTAKPNIYGSLAARALGIPVIANITGLGTAFLRQGWLARLVGRLYKVSLRSASTVFFQNPEDRDLFLSDRLVRAARAQLLPGSGVDLDHFHPVEESRADTEVRFLLVARLLRDKGVGEYVEAAQMVRQAYPSSRFRILGFADVQKRNAIAQGETARWTSDQLVDYLGHSDDVRPFIAAADCIVLPSYREGLPRVLLEAGAMGKPLIATDVPGCRHVIEDGKNGFLCAPRSPDSLAEAMIRMIQLPVQERKTMGARARRKVELNFDEKIVIERYLAAVREAIGHKPCAPEER